MSTILRAAEFLCLTLWLGGDVFLSLVVAPGAFAVLGTRDLAGTMVGYALTRLHLLGIICGVVFLLLRLLRTRTFASFAAPAALAVVLMIVLTAASQHGVSARLARLRMEMGSVEKTPVESPLRVEFDRLHRLSVRLEGGVLLAGLAALYFLVKELPAGH
jgi:hypothetical protein